LNFIKIESEPKFDADSQGGTFDAQRLGYAIGVGETPRSHDNGRDTDFCRAAVVRSFTATVASMLFFGWLLLLASGIEIAQAVMVGHWAGFFHHLLAAILFGVTGLSLVTRPLINAEVLTFAMAMFFLIGGLFQLIGSFVFALSGWGWQAVDGIITIILGAILRSGPPQDFG
jgi:uncharacterized membrane protein HdeD (DUF308 family)